MRPVDIRNDKDPRSTLAAILSELHRVGPVTQKQLETLSLYKEFSPDAFAEFEEKVLAAMGLFYKLGEASDLYTFLMKGIGEANRTNRGELLTPVQASMRRAISSKQFVSISAPTSAGKSYSIRDFISSEDGDAVIVVPSRALIAEYVAALRRYFANDKKVMILPFVESVFRRRGLRRIFVVTPERARELFERSNEINPKVFFFDEAQVSDEQGRGVVFDVLVRRVSSIFPFAKLIFAHPFVENPEAQFGKHGLKEESSFAKSYPQGAVGKVFVYQHGNDKDYYFSPFVENGHRIDNCVEFDRGFAEFALDGVKSILAYVSKRSIYVGKFTAEFDAYIDRLPFVDADEAISIISDIRDILGADNHEHRSKLISLMKRGVVIHHGSVPLEVRFLIEEFIRKGYARLCFATSTLAQGVNMPFDVVWLGNMRMQGGDEQQKALSFKNLIGRAGRLSTSTKYDYGYVYTRNPKLLSTRIDSEYRLSDVSVLDMDRDEVPGDVAELIESIRDGSFDDELHLPSSRLARLRDPDVMSAIREILISLYPSGILSPEVVRGRDNKVLRETMKERFAFIYEAYLGRALVAGERSVFREAIFIMLLTFSGRTFREIAGIRYSRISNRDGGRMGGASFSQEATDLPNISLVTPYSLFDAGTNAVDVSYDVVVFDTYDYLDKVISFCLSDVFSASAKVYYDHSKDDRAARFAELLRFGTNDSMHVLMMRYGFLPDQIEMILPHVLRINDDEIIFKRSIRNASDEIRSIVDWYM